MADTSSPFTERIRTIQRLTDRELSSQLNQLSRKKSELDAELLLYLSEIDRRGLYREQACSSLFEFCVTRLGCSEEVAYKRVGAARMLRQFPVVLELLANGRIHLTGLMLLKPHLTEANHREWLLDACGKSRRQIDKLIATRLPQPDARTSVRKLPEAKPPQDATSNLSGSTKQAAAASAQPSEVSLTSPTDNAMNTSTIPDSGEVQLDKAVQSSAVQSALPSASTSSMTNVDATQSRTTQAAVPTPTQFDTAQSGNAQAKSSVAAAPPRIAPLSSHAYRVVFTASERLKQKLDRACELLSHVIAPNDLPAVIERALDQLIEREEKRRYALHTKTEASKLPGRERVAAAEAVSGVAALSDRTAVSVETAASAETAVPIEAAVSAVPTVAATAASAVSAVSSVAATAASAVAAVEQFAMDLNVPCARESSECDGSRVGMLEREAPAREAPARESPASDSHAPCQKHAGNLAKLQDPDPNSGLKLKHRSRYVPAAVRREVFRRDGGQCTFVDQTGRRCEQRHFLEFDHREAFAIGGKETVDNLTIRCRSHNALAAEKLFGHRRIAGAIAHAKGKRVG